MRLRNYYWSGRATNGQLISGRINSGSKNLAQLELSKKGIQLVKLKRVNFLDFFYSPNKINEMDIILMLQQLLLLLNSGINILHCITLLKSTQKNTDLIYMLTEISINLQSGKNLSTALHYYPEHFDQTICSLIYLGEESGNLEKMLKCVTSKLENKMQFKKYLKQILFYPSCIIIVAGLSIVLMLTMIIPRFEEFFENANTKLPFLTLCIFRISELFRTYYPILFLLIPGCVYILKRYSISDTVFFKYLHNLIFYIDFPKNLALLLSAGINISDALLLIINSCKTKNHKAVLLQLQTQVNSGQALHTCMSIKDFPTMLIHMTKIGEESGNLVEMLEKAASIYEENLQSKLKKFHQLIEPLIMLVLGALIGLFIIAIYLPIIQLGSVVL